MSPNAAIRDGPEADVYRAISTGFRTAQSLIHGTRITVEEVIVTVLANRERL
ncbi:MAG: hypothetical protein LH477_00580 [Nocardioides sp.]|nr:hypothetical protein [Nocardioides sp.]